MPSYPRVGYSSMCTRLFLLCQIQGFMCNYKYFNTKDFKDQKLYSGCNLMRNSPHYEVTVPFRNI